MFQVIKYEFQSYIKHIFRRGKLQNSATLLGLELQACNLNIHNLHWFSFLSWFCINSKRRSTAYIKVWDNQTVVLDKTPCIAVCLFIFLWMSLLWYIFIYWIWIRLTYQLFLFLRGTWMEVEFSQFWNGVEMNEEYLFCSELWKGNYGRLYTI